MDLDFRFGGGHVRKMLLFYFKSEVAQLLGWSAYDAGRHAAAQRYFTQGLRLAREAGDAVVGGRLLSNLSHQANYLGKFNDAIQLARAAQTATRGVATPAVNSMFLAMEARGLAGSGNAKEFARVLAEAERSFGQHKPEDEPEWARYFNAEELAGEAAHCFRDLGRAEETRLYAARAIAPEATPPRTRAFIGMVTAAGALTNGDLDEAVTLALDAVDLAGPLQSSRYVRYLTDFHERLTAVCPRHPLVLRFAEEIVKQYPTLPLGSAVVLSRVA
ncbi:hypothetical protein [Actinosynnema pretiosum]|uniref:hypothetical protein n=1 Tax=Actinosynnema pretiosum TaxID=42197 RepID=UPI001E54BAE0|nr:hypothetical protein [Actinosynnema pretiosum]